MNCGGVKPYYLDGKITLSVVYIGKNTWIAPWSVCVFGWHRYCTVGTGKTVEEAIADWAESTGNSVQLALSMPRIGD